MFVKIHCSRKTQKHHIRLMGDNNKIILTSEPYASHSNAVRAARKLYGERVDELIDMDGSELDTTPHAKQ